MTWETLFGDAASIATSLITLVLFVNIGGFNVGDEYLGEKPKFDYWRDTHLRVIDRATAFGNRSGWAVKQSVSRLISPLL